MNGCKLLLWDLQVSAEVSAKPSAWINKSVWISHECLCPKTECASVS